RDYAGMLPRALAAVRVYRLRPAGRIANGGAAARRRSASRGGKSAGRYSGRPRHDTDRSEAAEIAAGAKSPVRTSFELQADRRRSPRYNPRWKRKGTRTRSAPVADAACESAE